jgi:hypothetical protein
MFHFIVLIYRKFNISEQHVSLRWGVLSPSLNHTAGGQPLVTCPRLLFNIVGRKLNNEELNNLYSTNEELSSQEGGNGQGM